jgi:hypothetical protein
LWQKMNRVWEISVARCAMAENEPSLRNLCCMLLLWQKMNEACQKSVERRCYGRK